jgi:hypothetical protein
LQIHNRCGDETLSKIILPEEASFVLFVKNGTRITRNKTGLHRRSIIILLLVVGAIARNAASANEIKKNLSA